MYAPVSPAADAACGEARYGHRVAFGVTGAALLERVRHVPAWRIDAVLATVFVLTALATTSRPDPVHEPRDGLAVGLVLAATVPYYARRRVPLPVLLVSLSATAGLFIGGYDAGALPFLVAVGIYTVGAHRPIHEVVAATVFVNVVLLAMLAADSPRFGVPELVTSVPVYAATMLTGWSMQSRRMRYDALEREQDHAEVRAAAQERLRIAQELHDVIGHSLGVIAVQAGVGMHLIDSAPDEAKQALEHISRTSRSSLAEIRQLLGLVRSGEGLGAPYAPTPGLADLPSLVDEVTDAGLTVDLSLATDGRELPPGVELAAYRIVQEALTNVRKHACASHATVRLDVERGALCVAVADDGTGPADGKAAGGSGLIGMRERVAVYGGSLQVGPNPGGGCRVAATLPFEADPA
jgi:signal transduction histidine kinase